MDILPRFFFVRIPSLSSYFAAVADVLGVAHCPPVISGREIIVIL